MSYSHITWKKSLPQPIRGSPNISCGHAQNADPVERTTLHIAFTPHSIFLQGSV